MLVSALGVVLLSVGLLVQTLTPILGRIALQLHSGPSTGNPSWYEPGAAWWGHRVVTLPCLLGGALLSQRFRQAAHREKVDLD